uniref:Uncharacterized protein LOC101497246 isoform X2 n=2 Tax=Cicer arietinum TaxID=3827 RepID=A0A3Q7YDM9_CICAR|nr:uncharacterized protein LOC101497246 isoform X2 [Cicer arietinum]
MKEEDAMVYRRPYLISGSSGFALNAITRTLKKDLKRYVEDMQTILKDESCNVPTTICWGQRDRWLSYDGVEDFCKDSNHTLIQVPKNMCHHWSHLSMHWLLLKSHLLSKDIFHQF